MNEGTLTTMELGIDGVEDAVEVGRGGFGSVYRARQTALQRTVAIKLLRDAITDRRVRSRFERECWAMGTLASHPNIITVHGSGFTGSGQPFIIMDFMPGGSLADRLDESGPLAWHEVVDVGVQLAGALETAHHSGVLHRDIKPENVLVSKYGEPQLADFGIARLQGREETKTDTLTASIAHVSPELLAGDRPSVASDVYALGSTLFMLLKGRPAFVHDTDESIVPALTRITSAPLPDLRSDGVPPPVCAVIERMMAKDPADRHPTAEQAGRALQECEVALGRPVTPITVIGEPTRRTGPLAGATNTISPEALAAAAAWTTGADTPPGEQAIDEDGAPAPTGTSAPPEPPDEDRAPAPAGATAPGTAADADEAPGASDMDDADGRAARRRVPALVALGAVVVVAAAVLGGLWLRGGPGQDTAEPSAEPTEAAPTDPGEADPGHPAAGEADEQPLAVLAASDLDGDWEDDLELTAAVTRAAPAYLCTTTTPETAPEVAGAAYRQGTPGPRAGHSVRRYAPGDAAAFMATLDDQIACLQQLPGLQDVAGESVDLGDEARVITYTRPGPDDRDLDVAVGFVRRGDTVGQVVHLGFPITDEDLVHTLLERADDTLPTGDTG